MPQTDKRAWLPVGHDLLPYFRLPAGFREVWSVSPPDKDYREVLIEGPFPDEVDDGGDVAAMVEDRDGELFFCWADAKTWKQLTDWMPIDG